MKRDMVAILACPMCKGTLDLHVEREQDGDVEKGTLTCPQCNETFPIEDFIPNLLPPTLRP